MNNKMNIFEELKLQKANDVIKACKYSVKDRYGKLKISIITFEKDEPKTIVFKCDCGYVFEVSIEEFEEKQYRSCGCEKLDNLLDKPRIKYKKSKKTGEYAQCQFSTVEDQDEHFLVDAEDVDLVVKEAKWFKTVDGHVRGRNNKTGEFYNIENEVVNQHPEHFF